MWTSFNRFEIQMTKKQALSASHSGDCESDVNSLLKLPAIKQQLKKIPDDTLQDELREYGAWDDEQLKNRHDNEQRIIWLAAGNIADDLR